jgi:hypothetical protein
MGWFSRKKAKTEAEPSNDMRDAPVDNPLDYRADGSIREGDPAWNFMMEAMTTGKAGIANQRPDGTWETKILDD